ncbi:MAG: glycosyl hydrolase 115 family protein [Kiritimatiellae bacterium]|nr:glycosyl hydrolase 115 family protein [Kiritimatiellia bacterium]
MKSYIATLSIALATAWTCAAAEPFRVSRQSMPAIVVRGTMRPFVMRAAEDVAADMEAIFGVRPEIASSAAPAENAIVLSKAGEGWENYTIESRPGNVLVITGSDDRGVMFGLYRFAADCLGVDPFRYWSGLEPAKADERAWDGISIRQGDPSFKFRGWFINDEDFLNGFRPKENGTRKIDYPRYHVCFGPALADKIYETAVRAGFNTMICASYVDILNPDEKRLVDIASSRGLYVTMHHQEPVGAGALQLDTHFPEIRGTTYASHPDLWRKAWRRYVGEWAKVPDVIWQLGLRGRRDRPFWMTFGALNAPDSPEEEEHRRAGLISSAMAEQLEMIDEALGRRPEHFATQLWMEGAEYYRRGLLKIPDGTIVIFSDNCPGLKFQGDIGGVKSLDLKKRFGLYYHLALVHGNHHCELVPPLRTHQVLGDAWRKGARELVLFNVSNVRPFLYTIAAAGEMTREMVGFKAAKFRDRWASARFGAKAAPAVARAIDLYFAAYETEPSRDARSSYGSPRQRAPLAILNDGRLCDLTRQMVSRFRSNAGGPSPVVSQYESDPDRLTDLVDNLFYRVNQDMLPDLCDWPRLGLRARLQAAAFARCAEQLERASYGMDEARKRLLFERFGYPTEFMRLSSECLAEITCAVEAKSLGDMRRAVGHAKTALACAETRDELICRYNSGKWEHWYDRDIIYPCAPLAESLRNALWKIQDEQSFDLSVAGDAVERVDFGAEAAGGYAEFEVHGMDAEASNAVLRIAYSCHPDGLSEMGDFWRETSARYLGPNVDLPILPASLDRYELYTLDHVGRYRAKLLQGLVRYARFSLDSKRGRIDVRNFRLVNDKVHSQDERAGWFRCSDTRFSDLWEASVRTCELSAVPSYVATHVTPNVKTLPYLADGAKRDRLVWSGDLWFAERSFFYGFKKDAPYLRGSIDLLAANQTPEGYVQACPWPEQPAPKAGEWGPFGSDEFACWFVPVLQDYYLHTADIDTLKRNYPKVVRLMAYLAKYQRDDGIFEQRRETCKHAAGLVFGGSSLHHRSYMNILLWKTYVDAASLADAVRGAEAEEWRAAAAKLAASIRRSFWNGNRGFFALSEEDPAMGDEANALALAVRFATKDEAARIMPQMRRIAHGKFQQLAARGRFEYGDAEGALAMLEDHNWYRILDASWKGPRLTSECMTLYTKGWGDEAHPDTCVASLYTNYVLGIAPLEPGFRAFAFNPAACDVLDSASGEVPTPHGPIRAAWWHENGRVAWNVNAPADATMLVVPAANLSPQPIP